MTSPHLIPDLMSDEGCRLTAYPDPLSGGDPWTIGYGATGPSISKGTVWVQEQADADLFFATVEGNLSYDNPAQRKLDLQPVAGAERALQAG